MYFKIVSQIILYLDRETLGQILLGDDLLADILKLTYPESNPPYFVCMYVYYSLNYVALNHKTK